MILELALTVALASALHCPSNSHPHEFDSYLINQTYKASNGVFVYEWGVIADGLCHDNNDDSVTKARQEEGAGEIEDYCREIKDNGVVNFEHCGVDKALEDPLYDPLCVTHDKYGNAVLAPCSKTEPKEDPPKPFKPDPNSKWL